MGIKKKLNFVISANTITGLPNKNGNDGTIARFGWKAQNKSLLIFSGEAYNVEMGISNELFQTEREENPNCQFKPPPNDTTNPTHITVKETDPNPDTDKRLELLSDIEKFASFMRVLAPPVPSSDTPGGSESIAKGKTSFSEVGCALCHTPTLHTVKFANPQLCEKSAIPQLCDKDVNLFSDLRFTRWVQSSMTASSRAKQNTTSSARHRSGVSGNAFFSCTTVERRIW